MSAVHDDDAAWLARQIDEEPGADCDVAAGGEADAGAGDEADAEVVDLDGPDTAPRGPVAVSSDGGAAARRFDHKVAAWFGGLVAVALVTAVVAAVGFYDGGTHSAPVPARDSVSEPAVAAAVSPPPAGAPSDAAGSDRPLPYTADAAGSCPPGSTSAQTMAGSDPRNAFVCVRGGVDGQVITIDLSKTFVITAISVTPGWIGQDSSGVSQWSQHRVVTIVQYTFNDTDKTLITQDTGNVRGEAVKPVKHVLASKIIMLIRQTSRPPADTAPTTSAQGPGLTRIFGDPAPQPTTAAPTLAPLVGDQANSDPVDATFAIASLKIIGHEAI